MQRWLFSEILCIITVTISVMMDSISLNLDMVFLHRKYQEKFMIFLMYFIELTSYF